MSAQVPAKALLAPDVMLERLTAVYGLVRAHAAEGADPLSFCLSLLRDEGPEDLLAALHDLPPSYQDHGIATIYTLLMDSQRRKRLGAYFTPPHLVAHLVQRLEKSGARLASARVHDPAAGGAAFVVPVARMVIRSAKAADLSDEKLVQHLRRLSGREVEPGLAKLANAIFRRMCQREFLLNVPDDFHLVDVGDTLEQKVEPVFDVIIGNPPYGKIGRECHSRWKKEFSDIACGQLNIYAIFVRRCLDFLKPGGVLGFVVPMSFLSGTEFRKFRKAISTLSDVVSIDALKTRSGLFYNVIQDTVFLVLRRRKGDLGGEQMTFITYFNKYGEVEGSGAMTIPSEGEPWVLPIAKAASEEVGFTLSDYGYRATVGHIVANRVRNILHADRADDRLPLVWAKAIRRGGAFEFERGRDHAGLLWARVPECAPYIIREPCVVVQRTANRSQAQRLNAAPVEQPFIDTYGGFVAENHVIVLRPISGKRAVSPAAVARLLNSPEINLRFDRLCGSASISARLLNTLELPDPAFVEGVQAPANDAALRDVREGAMTDAG